MLKDLRDVYYYPKIQPIYLKIIKLILQRQRKAIFLNILYVFFRIESDERRYRCDIEGCKKAYKNHAGLR